MSTSSESEMRNKNIEPIVTNNTSTNEGSQPLPPLGGAFSTPGSQKSTADLLPGSTAAASGGSITDQLSNINSKSTSICLLSALVALLSVVVVILVAVDVQENAARGDDIQGKLDNYNKAVQMATPGLAAGSPSTWQQIHPTNNGRAPHARLAHAAVAVGSKMYIHGGIYGRTTQVFDDLWMYDEAQNAWTEITTSGTKKPSARLHHSLVATPDDKTLLLFGGFNNFQGQTGHDSFDDLYRLDLSTMTWSEITIPSAATKPSKRGAHDCVWLGSQAHGFMYCFGGFATIGSTGHSDQMFKYSLSANTWTEITASPNKYDYNWPDGRIGFALAPISDTKVHMFGGGCSTDTSISDDSTVGQCGDDWIFDATTDQFQMINLSSSSAATPGNRRATHGDTSAFGLVFLFGGVFINGTSEVRMYDDLWVFQHDANQGGPRWMQLFPNYNMGSRPPKLFGHSVVRINDKVVVFGGRKGTPTNDGSNEIWEFHVVKPL